MAWPKGKPRTSKKVDDETEVSEVVVDTPGVAEDPNDPHKYENMCDLCSGEGLRNGKVCSACSGTGKIL